MTGSTHVLITKFLLHKYIRSQYFLGSLEFCHNLEWILLLPCPFPQISLTSLCVRPQLWHTLILMTGPLSSRNFLWALVLPHLQDVQMPRIFTVLFYLTKSNAQQLTNDWNCTHAWLSYLVSLIHYWFLLALLPT